MLARVGPWQAHAVLCPLCSPLHRLASPQGQLHAQLRAAAPYGRSTASAQAHLAADALSVLLTRRLVSISSACVDQGAIPPIRCRILSGARSAYVSPLPARTARTWGWEGRRSSAARARWSEPAHAVCRRTELCSAAGAT
jgi:hypothetical protein